MPNGKSGDHPVTDLVHYGRHPFPRDVEALVLRLHRLDPSIWSALEWAPFDWEAGKHLDHARTLLASLITAHGDPAARRAALIAYREAAAR